MVVKTAAPVKVTDERAIEDNSGRLVTLLSDAHMKQNPEPKAIKTPHPKSTEIFSLTAINPPIIEAIKPRINLLLSFLRPSQTSKIVAETGIKVASKATVIGSVNHCANSNKFVPSPKPRRPIFIPFNQGAFKTDDRPSIKAQTTTSVETANKSLTNIKVMGCQTSKRTSAAGNPAANKNIDTKAKVFPATSWLLDFKGTLKILLLSKSIF